MDKIPVLPATLPHLLMIGNFLSVTKGLNISAGDRLVAGLRKKGWTVITTSDQPHPIRRLFDILLTVWITRMQYRIVQIDVFSGRAFIWAEAAVVLLRILRKPYILTLHGGNLPAFSKKNPRRVRSLFKHAAAITAPSRYLQSQLTPFRADIRVVPNAVDLTAYPFRQRSQIRPLLVWLRAIDIEYNVLMAAQVINALRKSIPEIHLLLVGPIKNQPIYQELQAFITLNTLQDHITIAGKVPFEEVGEWINRGDIFINTTNVDNTPVSVIQAMACGACVISTNVGGLQYLLTNDHDALLVPANDVSAMCTAVQRCIDDPILASRLSVHARQTVEAFDWSKIISQWEQLLMEVGVENHALALQ